MKIFGFPLSPFVRKVHLVAAEKGVAIEPVIWRPGQPHPEFLAASPFGKIPAMTHGDFSLCDSTAIVTYIEALHPRPAMIPAAPKARALAIWFEEFGDTIMVPPGAKVSTNRFVRPAILKLPGDEAEAAEGAAELAPVFDYLETQAPAEGWLAGDEFSIGDITVAAVFKSLSYVDFAPDAAKHPATAAWYARVCARPAWREIAEREAALVAQVTGS